MFIDDKYLGKAMSNLIRVIKSINIRQVLTVFLAGSLLIFSTACSQGNIAQAGGKEYTETAKRAMSDTYDDYDANQEFKGGMNGYNDDRRYNGDTAAKVKSLVDTAERRKADNLGEFADNIGNRAGDNIDKARRGIPREVKDNLQDAKEDISRRTDRLQKNVSKVPEETKKVLGGAAETAGNAVDDLTTATSKTAKNIKGNFKDLDLEDLD